ncbi:MAG: phosphorylase [Planctomycetota bacterium]
MCAGEVWPAILRSTERGLASGALQPLETECVVIEDAGIPFLVRRMVRLEKKRKVTESQRREGVNPFLPPAPDLLIGELSDTHLAVLNKFNVFPHHLLIVTRSFEDQEERLTLADFEALCLCMAGYDGLGFYNAGAVAGASQPHKHLQLVPVPLGEGRGRTPVDRLIEGRGQLPFRHALSRLGAGDGPEFLCSLYEDLLQASAAGDDPYNLLVTRDWMLLVPRSRERFMSMSVNALGFAGSLLTRTTTELDELRRLGPMSALRTTAFPL